ncbi:MAG: DUF5320 domain-containing protein [candidate division NC10 bacterium]|nr:DUF5320 domain-containing protein [candidate division NC10 bacterium]
MCHPYEMPGHRHHPWGCICGCGCCGGVFFRRRYISSAEEREMLESYIEELKKELTGAEERLKSLKK